jgi:hypothetical protein
MITIDWNEFKNYKHEQGTAGEKDNFMLLNDFIKSYYNVVNYFDAYDMLRHDELSAMMLEKRNITSAETLERFLKQ